MKHALLTHITLNNGRRRKSTPQGINPAVTAALGKVLEIAVSGRRVPLPIAPFRLSAAASSGCLIANVWYEQAAVMVLGVAPPAAPCAQHLWRTLLGQGRPGDLHGDADETPVGAWCASVQLEGWPVYGAKAPWLEDFERCLSWAWLQVE